jgi:hypothetical protein
MVDFVEVSLGKGGPAACSRCGGGEEPHYRPAFEVAAEIEAACVAWGAGPGPNVALTGPEPFGSPDPAGLVSTAARAGAQRIRIDTDGAAFARPGVSAEMLEAGLRHVRVSLADDPEGALGPSLAGMRAFADEAAGTGIRVAVSAHVRVCRHNLEALPVTIAAAAEAGASHVVLEVADGRLDVRGAMPWIAAACDSGTVNCTWVEVAGVPYCLAGGLALHLVPVFRPVPPPSGAKTDACRACVVDDVCAGLPAQAAPTIVAAIAPRSVEKELAESIRRAFVEPGPGEVE